MLFLCNMPMVAMEIACGSQPKEPWLLLYLLFQPSQKEGMRLEPWFLRPLFPLLEAPDDPNSEKLR